MPRTARVIDPAGGVYHVICRGNNKATVFHDTDDHLSYLTILSHCKVQHPYSLFHYVLMHNHVHLLLTPAATSELSVIMKTINQSYSLHYKRKYGFVGHLWQDRFKSLIISDDSYLLTCGAYIELNPVRANIVNDPKDYQWSSYRHYALGERNDLIERDVLYDGFGRDETERQWRYKEYIKMWQSYPPTKFSPAGTVPSGTVPGGDKRW